MTHKDMLDAATYAWNGVHNYDPKLGCFITTYHRESEPIYPASDKALKSAEELEHTSDDWMSKYLCRPVVNWPKRDPYPNYVEQDLISTEELRNILNKEKENKTMETNRELMHSLKKGMLVEFVGINSGRGYIEAFDYTHSLVGVRVEGRPSYANLRWINPHYLHVIALPDGNAVQTLNGPCPKPKRVVYDETAGITVVLWEDGQKTIVRATEGEQMDVYDAFCAAYCKRVYGTNSALKRELNKILTVNHPKEPEQTKIPSSELGKTLKDIKDGLANAFNK